MIRCSRVRWRQCLAAAAALFLATGCSTFGRDWKRAGGATADANGLAGRWEGEWRSHASRHRGSLRAIATPVGEYRYHVRYRAGFAGIFRSNYQMELDVTPAPAGGCALAGQASLRLFGTYQCVGRADGTNFFARYATSGDFGIFEMQRPSP